MYNKLITDKDGEKYVGLCSHCGNDTSQKILFRYVGSEKIDFGPNDDFDVPVDYTLVECMTCEELLLYYRPAYEQDELLGFTLYPSQAVISSSVPQNIRKAYGEARRIYKLAPNAFAILIRRALEFICKDKKIAGRNLKECVGNMASSGLIPPVLSEMADGLRILGNYGAHASDIEFTFEDTVLMDDFIKAILEYVYVAPDKISRFKMRINSIKKDVSRRNNNAKTKK